MAYLHSARPHASLTKQWAKFTNSTAGLDLALRLAQALTQIAAELCFDNAIVLHDMNIWLVSWYIPVLMEGNKFWFYAICTSIIRSVGTLLFGLAGQEKTQNGHSDTDQKRRQGRPVPSKPALSITSLLKQIVVDGCDLTLPASFLGWISLGDLGVGGAMVVSTVLAWGDVWSRVQL
ncbi:hypothetical protein V493_03949 [Pseudogymnoascus sp. VKM F-4281 (FW-2241)]|nr:hypothetical protein V493_03949 [Pseudogymnoascus sp. VKM F-4281 (FW-2241)]